jgi:hypothetical protein
MFRERTSKRYDEARKWTENEENRADHSVARGEAAKPGLRIPEKIDRN